MCGKKDKFVIELIFSGHKNQIKYNKNNNQIFQLTQIIGELSPKKGYILLKTI